MAFKKKIDIGSTESFKFEKLQQSLEGYYVGTFEIVIDGRDVKKHVFQTDAGLISVLGQTHLTQLLGGISPGTLVRISYVGSKKTKPGRQPMKLFELEYDEEQTLDVGTIVDRSNEPSEPTQDADDAGADSEDGYEAEAEEAEEAPPARPAARPASRPAQAARPAPKAAAVSPEQKARVQSLLGKKN